MGTRAELIAAIEERYRVCARTEKRRILDELVAVSGYHRKHAIRLLRKRADTASVERRSRPVYGTEVRDALIVLWETSDRVCSKRLRPLIPDLVPALERHGKFVLNDELRARLLSISAATIDRLLSDVRLAAAGGRRRRAGMSSAVRRAVPVRTFNDWGDPPAGFVEADLVAHGGTSVSGSFVQTMVLTDIATGWTECVPILLREGGLVIEAITKAKALFPFPLRGVDFDNDSVFMNEVVVGWCREAGLDVTRARAYRKNDQAWVEQKNGAIVRRLVGYGRFEGVLAARTLSRLYAAARLHANLFQPSFKLKTKTRIGARVVKRYHAPVTPLVRALLRPDISEADKDRLKTLRANSDPVLLLAAIRAAQDELGRRVDRRGLDGGGSEPIVVDLDRFAAGLKGAWRDGEQRPTHRRPYHRRKPIPRRGGMVDEYEDQVRAWLNAEPSLAAQEVLTRLIEALPGKFNAKHLRTIQRAVKAWRSQIARKLIMDGFATLLDSPLSAAAPEVPVAAGLTPGPA